MSRNRWSRIAVGLIVVLSLALAAGCGSDDNDSGGATGTSATKTTQEARGDVAIVTSVSLKSSYGKALLGGIDKIRNELGNKVDVAEQVPPSAFVSTLKELATRGYKLVLLDGTDLQEATLKTAPQFPETMFVVVNGFQPAKPNVAAVDFQFEQAGFLAGVVAGLTTKTNKVANIGGIQIPPLARLFGGFEQGLKYVNKNAQSTSAYTGSWIDAGKAEQVARAQLSKGVDVIWTIAGAGNSGVYKAAQDKQAGAIAYGADDSASAPGTLITTATVDYGKVIFDLTKEFNDGQLKPTLETKGFNEGVLGLAPFGDFVDKAIVDKATALAEKAQAGEITIKQVSVGG